MKHASDCSLHNAPALPTGKCDCGAAKRQRLLRSAKTKATYKVGMGGIPKTMNAPKTVTLAKLKCLDDNND